jgi:hypothetical protein
MQMECIAGQLKFEGFDRQRLVAALDGNREEQLMDGEAAGIDVAVGAVAAIGARSAVSLSRKRDGCCG